MLLAVTSWPAGASGAPSGTISQRLQDKKAQAAKAESELATLRSQLTTALAEFDRVTTELEAVRQDLLDAAEARVGLDGEIEERQAALDERAVAMYKAGGYVGLEALLSVRSFEDLFSRLDMLSYIQRADSELLTGLAAAREQNEFLQQLLPQREAELIALRQQVAARRAQVEAATARQEELTKSLGADVTKLVREQEAADAAAAAGGDWGGASEPPVAFNPNTLVSDAKYLDVGSMSVDSVQAFLDSQPGSLKSYRGPDHNGVTKTAAQMIADAAIGWGVSPKVILVTLQKEQSLISRSDPSQTAMDWAMGCGKTDSVTYTQYRGFGRQIWGGAQKLISNRSFWHQGISLSIDRQAVYPTNASTHALYRYTPHLGGATSFWRLYWRYFGDPIS